MTTHLPATAHSLALALEAKSVEESISILQKVFGDLSSSPDNLRIKEQAITKLTEFLTQENKAENLQTLLTQLRPYFTLIPKALEDPRAVYSMKYMLLCKVMVNQADDVAGIISSKAGLQYLGPDLDAMKAIADAYSKRSLKLFEASLENFKAQLGEDPIIHRHLSSLYGTLLEQNLCRLIEPFVKVEIAHIAELIELPVDHVESKLSQVILDKKFAGTLDQSAGCLIIFNDPKTDVIYEATLESISNVTKVVDSLFDRSVKIMA